MKKFRLATVIVNYKQEQRTIKFVLEELLAKCKLPQVIVIVNNGATENTTTALASALGAAIVTDVASPLNSDGCIFVLHSVENSGFARGNNIGVDFVMRHFIVDYILFSNNDIVMDPARAIERLIDRLDSLPDAGMIGPKVKGLDGHCQSPYVCLPFWTYVARISWERFLPFKVKPAFIPDAAGEGFYYRIMGAFFIVRAVDYARCGGMDGRTFLYCEELILSERMLAIGKRAYYYPAVSVFHEHGQTISRYIGSVKSRMIHLRSAMYYFRAYKGVGQLAAVCGFVVVALYVWMQFGYRKLRSWFG